MIITDKQKESYQEYLTWLKLKKPTLQPASIQTFLAMEASIEETTQFMKNLKAKGNGKKNQQTNEKDN